MIWAIYESHSIRMLVSGSLLVPKAPNAGACRTVRQRAALSVRCAAAMGDAHAAGTSAAQLPASALLPASAAKQHATVRVQPQLAVAAAADCAPQSGASSLLVWALVLTQTVGLVGATVTGIRARKKCALELVSQLSTVTCAPLSWTIQATGT